MRYENFFFYFGAIVLSIVLGFLFWVVSCFTSLGSFTGSYAERKHNKNGYNIFVVARFALTANNGLVSEKS